jgi:hypothetical protein
MLTTSLKEDMLTTLMGYHENIGIPTAYLITDEKDTASYEFFLW